MPFVIRLLSRTDAGILDQVAPGVFDHAVIPSSLREFLEDARHHLVVAIDLGVVVGMASAVHYVHPDKPNELWINEVAVAPSHQRQGIGTALVQALLGLARQLGCREAWVLTDRENTAARRLYTTCGALAPGQETLMYTFPLDGVH
jgi:GNAT superfamily N-acetyltransferase